MSYSHLHSFFFLKWNFKCHHGGYCLSALFIFNFCFVLCFWHWSFLSFFSRGVWCEQPPSLYDSGSIILVLPLVAFLFCFSLLMGLIFWSRMQEDVGTRCIRVPGTIAIFCLPPQALWWMLSVAVLMWSHLSSGNLKVMACSPGHPSPGAGELLWDI